MPRSFPRGDALIIEDNMCHNMAWARLETLASVKADRYIKVSLVKAVVQFTQQIK